MKSVPPRGSPTAFQLRHGVLLPSTGGCVSHISRYIEQVFVCKSFLPSTFEAADAQFLSQALPKQSTCSESISTIKSPISSIDEQMSFEGAGFVFPAPSFFARSLHDEPRAKRPDHPGRAEGTGRQADADVLAAGGAGRRNSLDRAADQAGQVAREDFVCSATNRARYGLLDRDCPHRGADLDSPPRRRRSALRLPWWLFDSMESAWRLLPSRIFKTLRGIRPRAYRWWRRAACAGLYLGEGSRRHFPELDWLRRPVAYTFAFKGLFECNWLQAMEVGIDPAHASSLHPLLRD